MESPAATDEAGLSFVLVNYDNSDCIKMMDHLKIMKSELGH